MGQTITRPDNEIIKRIIRAYQHIVVAREQPTISRVSIHKLRIDGVVPGGRMTLNQIRVSHKANGKETTCYRLSRFRKLLHAAALQILELHRLLDEQPQGPSGYFQRLNIVEPMTAHARVV